MYVATGIRSDITLAVSNVAKLCLDPTKRYWIAVKRISRYLKGTSDLGLLYSRGDGYDCFGYSDSDWAGDVGQPLVTHFILSGAGITWRSKKQSSVALSSAEAEYIDLSGAAQEVIWLRRLIVELDKRIWQSEAIMIYEDNQAAN
jgi:hypothetical protein